MLFYFQEIPWSAEVTASGWFAVWFEKKVDGHHLWFIPISDLKDALLKSNPGSGSVTFTVQGVFTGVSNTKTHLRITNRDLNAYGGKPLSVEIVKLPRH